MTAVKAAVTPKAMMGRIANMIILEDVRRV